MDFVDNNILKVLVSQQDKVYAKNEDIKVYGKLVSISTENIVADSELIWDESLKKNLSDINADLYKHVDKYLPLTGGTINGDLSVTGDTNLGTSLTLGDSLNVTENNFWFEAEDNESLMLDGDGLTFSYGKTQQTGFKVKDGVVSANNITVIPDNNHPNNHSHAVLEPDSLSIDDGKLEVDITPSKISFDMSSASGDTSVTAKTINTNKVLLQRQSTSTSAKSNTALPESIELIASRHGKDPYITNIQASLVTSPAFIKTDSTAEDVLLGDGTTTKINQPNGLAKLDANCNVPLKNLGNLDTLIVIVTQLLPTSDIKTNKIYLVPNAAGKGDNVYDEYIYVNSKWEKLCEYKADVDLTNYSKLEQTVDSANLSIKDAPNKDGKTLTLGYHYANEKYADPIDVTISLVNTTDCGFMSPDDKKHLDRLINDNYPFAIASFSNNSGGTIEKGLVRTFQLTWSYKNLDFNTVDSLIISGGSFSAPITLADGVRSQNVVSLTDTATDYAKTFTYTLTAKSGSNTKTALTSVTFVHRSFAGVVTADKTSLTSADIKALTNLVIQNSKSRTISISQSNQKIAYCYPAYLGNLTSIKDSNGFQGFSGYTKTQTTVDNVVYNVYLLNIAATASGSYTFS